MNTEVLYNNDLDTDINNILQDGIEVVSKDLKIKWYKTFIKNLKKSLTHQAFLGFVQRRSPQFVYSAEKSAGCLWTVIIQ